MVVAKFGISFSHFQGRTCEFQGVYHTTSLDPNIEPEDDGQRKVFFLLLSHNLFDMEKKGYVPPKKPRFFLGIDA